MGWTRGRRLGIPTCKAYLRVRHDDVGPSEPWEAGSDAGVMIDLGRVVAF